MEARTHPGADSGTCRCCILRGKVEAHDPTPIEKSRNLLFHGAPHLQSPFALMRCFLALLILHRRTRKFSSLKKMVEWYMGGEKARRRKPNFWKMTLRGAEASSDEERGAGRGGCVWIPPPPEEQRGVREEVNERVMGKMTFTDDGDGGIEMDTSGMSPMRMSGGGGGNSGGELMRLKGGMKLFTHNILSSPVHGIEVKNGQAPQLPL